LTKQFDNKITGRNYRAAWPARSADLVVHTGGLDISVIENLILYSPTILYSQCVKTGNYVEFKKKSKVLPIFKRDDSNIIIITIKLSKIMEKGLFKLILRNT
jgi:hypothetical protein